MLPYYMLVRIKPIGTIVLNYEWKASRKKSIHICFLCCIAIQCDGDKELGLVMRVCSFATGVSASSMVLHASLSAFRAFFGLEAHNFVIGTGNEEC